MRRHCFSLDGLGDVEGSPIARLAGLGRQPVDADLVSGYREAVKRESVCDAEVVDEVLPQLGLNIDVN